MSQFELCSLWKKKDKNGNPYLSGQLPSGLDLRMDGQWVNIYPNKNKTKDNQPDFRVVVSERTQRNIQYTQDQQDQMMHEAHEQAQDSADIPF